ncbi:inner nuclear membrane protein MAN1 [Rhodotorula toruloides]|uniref:Inner nuclear membrane protein MAN1 n=1 Tax=Rhodotorula toruloides TaxID=5286 RepID=A0A511KGG2_RHOTO|nr:inner nuclear membrane protein MAN1 [Rhodotorula toruloides]
MTTPPAYLLPDYDTSKAKVAELRGILLAHDVPYQSNAKKPELIRLFQKHVLPQAQTLLDEMRAVRASDDGVLDGESQGSSLRELDTDYEQDTAGDEEMDARPVPRKKDKARAGTSTKTRKDGAMRNRKGKGNATETDETAGTETEDSAVEQEEENEGAPPPKKRATKGRKSVRLPSPPDEMEVDDDGNVQFETVEYEAPRDYEAPLRGSADKSPKVSPRKRKAQDDGPTTPRLSDLTAPSKRKSRRSLGAGGDGNFSDFNPFQSGGEETPQRDTKRRKSSLGPARLQEEKQERSRLSPRKSLPALSAHKRDAGTAGDWSRPGRGKRVFSAGTPSRAEDEVLDEMPEQEAPPAPSTSRSPARARHSLGGALSSTSTSAPGSARGTPVGVQYMVPVNKVKTTPPQMAAFLRERQQSPTASPAAGRVAGPSPYGSRRKSSSPAEEIVQPRSQRRVAHKGRRNSDQGAIEVKSTSRSLPTVDLSGLGRIARWAFAALLVTYVLWWREEKLAAGFCDTNASTNALLASRHTSLAAPLPDLPPSLLNFADHFHLRPSCTPCPTHGHCVDGAFVGCTVDYVPRQNPLRLGGLLPIPPACVPDTEKLMMVAMQASKASRLLRQRRGEVICHGLEKHRRKQGQAEAWVYGLNAEAVLAALRSENERAGRPFAEDVLEEVNRIALRDLEAHGEVDVWQDKDGPDDYWYAAKTAEMSLSCRARLAAIQSAKRHRSALGGFLGFLSLLVWLHSKLRSRRADAENVRQLVQVALRQLQQQERAHYADPVLIPFPHVVPSHLRDLILQDEHSPGRRAALWKGVEKVVEGNANVRVLSVEQNGEEMRGWLWTGPTGRIEAAPGERREERLQMVEGSRALPSLQSSPVKLQEM